MRRFSAARGLFVLSLLGLLLVLPGQRAQAQILDCSIMDCLDASYLPPSGPNDMAEVIRRAQGFYGVDTRVYVVSHRESAAKLPVFVLKRPGLIDADQIHVPDIYHASIEFQHAGEKHFIWHYIIGHEMAHAFQKHSRLIEAMGAGMFRSNVAVELHADFMAGFFLGREYGLDVLAIDQLARELETIPAGKPGDVHFHGAPRQRYFVMTQGALFALRRPVPTLNEANAEAIGVAFDHIPNATQTKPGWPALGQ
ncbi:MAG: hypothetical protein MRY63_11720 [Neomegalonema sp.]|nr:hypothetical protein [Neomegalonema sp.]